MTTPVRRIDPKSYVSFGHIQKPQAAPRLGANGRPLCNRLCKQPCAIHMGTIMPVPTIPVLGTKTTAAATNVVPDLTQPITPVPVSVLTATDTAPTVLSTVPIIDEDSKDGLAEAKAGIIRALMDTIDQALSLQTLEELTQLAESVNIQEGDADENNISDEEGYQTA